MGEINYGQQEESSNQSAASASGEGSDAKSPLGTQSQAATSERSQNPGEMALAHSPAVQALESQPQVAERLNNIQQMAETLYELDWQQPSRARFYHPLAELTPQLRASVLDDYTDLAERLRDYLLRPLPAPPVESLSKSKAREE